MQTLLLFSKRATGFFPEVTNDGISQPQSRKGHKRFATIQHMPLFVIPAFSGDCKGDAESRNLISLLFRQGSKLAEPE